MRRRIGNADVGPGGVELTGLPSVELVPVSLCPVEPNNRCTHLPSRRRTFDAGLDRDGSALGNVSSDTGIPLWIPTPRNALDPSSGDLPRIWNEGSETGIASCIPIVRKASCPFRLADVSPADIDCE